MAFEKKYDGGTWTDEAGQRRGAQVVIAVGADGGSVSDKKQYTLLAGATATGSQVGPISGGDYIWRAESANWNGATATLQYLGLDGATWNNVKDSANADVTLTANGSKAIGVAQGSVMRVSISGGTPAPMNSVIGGL